MGIRMTQVIGLNERGQVLIEGQEVFLYTLIGRKIFADGHEESYKEDFRDSNVKVQRCGEFEGMFGDPYDLQSYTLPDGQVYAEAVQAQPWSSGPCVFLALKGSDGQWIEESLWTDAEIEESL